MVDYLEQIRKGECTLIIRKDGRLVFKSNDSGIKGLVFALKKGFLKDAVIYDKTVGLAAAKIAVFSKAKELYALLASKLAVAFCRREGVPLNAEKVAERIYDAENKKGCYLEKMAQMENNISDLINYFNNLYEI